MYKVFNKIVYNNVKKRLGLNESIKFFSGAAPLPLKTRQFFFNLGIFINNTFGMSETAGPMTSVRSYDYPQYDLKSAGKALPGTEVVILKTDPKGETGEICLRGRNIFMGYLKNEQATKDCIDDMRRVHSGDEGKLNQDGMMQITGRIKELLKTAGGEQIAPVIIEMNVKDELPFLSNVMAVGDQMKYVSAILTFKTTTLTGEMPNRILSPEAIEEIEKYGIKGLKTVEEAAKHPELLKVIQAGIDRANKKAISNAAKIKSWMIVLDDFSLPGGEFTPTMKLKRPVVVKKYAKEILDLYNRPEI